MKASLHLVYFESTHIALTLNEMPPAQHVFYRRCILVMWQRW